MNTITAVIISCMLFIMISNAYSADKIRQSTKGYQSPAVNIAPGGTANFNYMWKGVARKQVNAKIVSINKYTKEELNNLDVKLGIAKFDLSLDDIILKDYYLIRLRFNNPASAINQPLKFKISTGTSDSKVISIKYKVHRPRNKTLEIVDSIPKANWVWPENGIIADLTWEYASDDMRYIAGFNVYRSLLKASGYGQVNSKLITSYNWVITEEARRDLSPNYYKIAAVNTWGEELLSPEPIVVQNFTPITRSSYEKKAFAEDNYRFESSKSQFSLSKNDLRFARGSVDISFENGLDSGADIETFLLCKMLPDSVLAPEVSLVGAPSVSFNLHGKPQRMRSPPAQINISKIREALTPLEARAYSSTNSIYIVWKKPKTPDFEGVRIFRSPERRLGNFSKHPGEEVYDGPGLTKNIELELPNRDAIALHQTDDVNNWDENFIDPPQRLKPAIKLPPIPSPPSGLKMIIKTTLERDYFIDSPLDKQKSYTYTIYSYDNNGNSGYPIFLNTSISEHSQAVSESQ